MTTETTFLLEELTEEAGSAVQGGFGIPNGSSNWTDWFGFAQKAAGTQYQIPSIPGVPGIPNANGGIPSTPSIPTTPTSPFGGTNSLNGFMSLFSLFGGR
jgi:hypothetical protein